MAAYSPPTTPQLGEDICEDLLRHLDEQIQATQQQHNEAKKKAPERKEACYNTSTYGAKSAGKHCK